MCAAKPNRVCYLRGNFSRFIIWENLGNRHDATQIMPIVATPFSTSTHPHTSTIKSFSAHSLQRRFDETLGQARRKNRRKAWKDNPWHFIPGPRLTRSFARLSFRSTLPIYSCFIRARWRCVEEEKSWKSVRLCFVVVNPPTTRPKSFGYRGVEKAMWRRHGKALWNENGVFRRHSFPSSLWP